jgi:hypothetical protein
MKSEEVLISWLDLGPPCQTPDLSGGSMIDLADAGVEPPDAPESGGKSDLAHRQSRLVDQLLRKVKTSSVRHRDRSGAQMPQKQPPKVTRADSKALRQDFYSTVGQTSVANQTQRS